MHKQTVHINLTNINYLQTQPYHSHYTGQPLLAGTPIKNNRFYCSKVYCLYVPLLTAIISFR